MMPCARVTGVLLYSSEGGNSPGSGSSDRCWPLLLHLSIDNVTIWGYTPQTALRYPSHGFCDDLDPTRVSLPGGNELLSH